MVKLFNMILGKELKTIENLVNNTEKRLAILYYIILKIFKEVFSNGRGNNFKRMINRKE